MIRQIKYITCVIIANHYNRMVISLVAKESTLYSRILSQISKMVFLDFEMVFFWDFKLIGCEISCSMKYCRNCMKLCYNNLYKDYNYNQSCPFCEVTLFCDNFFYRKFVFVQDVKHEILW